MEELKNYLSGIAIGVKFRNNYTIKEQWPSYIMGLVGLLALFFFVTMNVRMAETSKDISYLYMKIDENTQKVEKVSDEVQTLREQVLLYRGDLKSLDDRFAMFIELFRRSGNAVE